MTFLAPGFLYAGVAVAAAIVALHFIVTRQPRSSLLPTARFVPDTRTTAISRSTRPTDWLLMALRALTILAAGAGLAKPVVRTSRAMEARVILADLSRSTRDSAALRDSVRAIYRDGDAIVLFDSVARVATGETADSINQLRPTGQRGNLSAALIAAFRAGSVVRDRADSLELVVVSPLAREEIDAATDSIRALWPGRARLVRMPMTIDTARGSGSLALRVDVQDPVAIAAQLARVSVSAEGGVDWPAGKRPRWAVSRAVKDTVGGVDAGDARVVAPFARQWSYPPDSLRGGEVIARWADGEPAAVEKPDADSCARSVAISVSPVGDLSIRHDFVRMVATMAGPCARETALIPVAPERLAKLAGSGALAPRQAFEPRADARSLLAPWLFALALLATITELLVRRRARQAEFAGGERPSTREARAA